MNELKCTCIHEAGHLLMSILMNNKWSVATVVKDLDSCGHVKAKIPPADSGFAKLLLAGGVAEDIMGIPASGGAAVEYQEAVNLVGTRKVRDLIGDLLITFTEHKKTLKAIADHLEQSNTITPDDLTGNAKMLELRVATDALLDSIQQKLDLLAHS